MEANTKMNQFYVNTPYPKIKVEGKNSIYADLIQINYAGMVSELTAITQYVNHEIRLVEEYPEVHDTLEGIAMVEMRHLQMLGELICQLGGNPGYWINKKNKKLNWTPDFIDYGTDLISMIKFDIQGEEAAIKQYRETATKISDQYVVAIINRIILDEELHIKILNNLLSKYSK